MNRVPDRHTQTGSGPGVHALIVGVGQYPQSSFPRLMSSVSSAKAVAEWLRINRLAVPLSTCRVLLSDGAGGGARVEQFLRAASEWREDAGSNKDNIAFFYFCGMGFQRSATEDLILFEDFGAVGPALRGAVSVDNLFQGMAPGPDAPDIARTQLYFIDSSRTYEEFSRYQFSSPTLIFDEYHAGADDRSAVVFYATQPGTAAYAISGEKASLFTTALLRCLEGEAATALDSSPPVRWGVTINSLIEGLHKVTKSLNDVLGLNALPMQVPVVGGLVRDRVIRYLEETPLAAVKVRVGQTPLFSDLSVENSDGRVVYQTSIDPKGEVQLELPSGFYVIRVKSEDGSRHASRIASLRPGSSDLLL